VMSTATPSVYEWTSRKGVQRVRDSNGDYAFFLESVFAKHLVGEKPCDLKVLDDYLNPSYYSFAVAKKSKLRKRLNKALAALEKNGVLERLKQKWWRGRCNKNKGRVNPVVEVSNDMQQSDSQQAREANIHRTTPSGSSSSSHSLHNTNNKATPDRRTEQVKTEPRVEDTNIAQRLQAHPTYTYLIIVLLTGIFIIVRGH